MYFPISLSILLQFGGVFRFYSNLKEMSVSKQLGEPDHRGTDKPLFGVFKQFNFGKSNCFLNEGVMKSNLILEKAKKLK